MALDRRAGSASEGAAPSASMPHPAAGADGVPLADSGVLAGIVVLEGRAVGTLGMEAEMRRRSAALVPKKVRVP